ncbi:Gpi16 subunit GPI transamidase component [Guyanagaster necrorhizus]|uniref:Gpi16 subunit GPI transamidase component n=1 Tax=Guyanagaster necrorhizus TaxID=856835 RepID=A0A9P7VP93_9AGAR|nr:Gpi16 subunit GPI transamidase component [Guyanagaster necrorhizus MCA 3950]KAG7444102.1 Gpi16 subunit GPI transamidase component [Guyanagaster necrorhizus MCA 3950]
MLWRCCLVLIGALCTPVLSKHLSNEEFREQVSLQTLQDGRVASTFSFNILLKDATPREPRTLIFDDESQHYNLFPLALGQILREYAVTELHLTLNAGKWNYDSWGYPKERDVGTGAALWAWMADGGPTSIDYRWQGLRNALAGLFCASIGSLDEQRTTSPVLPFAPEGSLPDWGVEHELRHASLASEHVCTENLTPFLKLLPCKSLSGIASLLNPHRLFDADWHGMGLHVLWNPDAGVEVRLAFQLVSDPLRISAGKKQDWSFSTLFDRTIERTCPVAQSSIVDVALPREALYNISPEPPRIDQNVAFYDLTNMSEALDVKLKWALDFTYPLDPLKITSMPISVRRTLQGASQDRGQLSLVIKNNAPFPLQVLYLETMPWIVQFYLHTMRVSSDTSGDDFISNISYVPSVPHSRPATFQAVLTLPTESTVYLTIDVTKAFLRYTEHPPDAQRGWDLPPAIILPLSSSNAIRSEFVGRIYTPPLLVDLATPDFSMPYNVIVFSCSLIAFIFGNIFNLLTRKFVVVRLGSQQGTSKSKHD